MSSSVSYLFNYLFLVEFIENIVYITLRILAGNYPGVIPYMLLSVVTAFNILNLGQTWHFSPGFYMHVWSHFPACDIFLFYKKSVKTMSRAASCRNSEESVPAMQGLGQGWVGCRVQVSHYTEGQYTLDRQDKIRKHD